MRAVSLLLLVAVAGCGCGSKPAPTATGPAATGPTAREYTARDRAARRALGHPLLTIPGVGTVRWRVEDPPRYVTMLYVPAGGATESVWMTVDGRLVKIGELQPGDQADAGPVARGPVDIKIVQSTEPKTVTARIRVVYNRVEPVPLVTARVRTRSHSRP